MSADLDIKIIVNRKTGGVTEIADGNNTVAIAGDNAKQFHDCFNLYTEPESRAGFLRGFMLAVSFTNEGFRRT